ncbi:hypothetical protein BDD12DRAFT_837679 [Trichophaea hybrida]|nr:hypothetical protein BDD12DRAFT_837679 [Trichophaea hybrida]
MLSTSPLLLLLAATASLVSAQSSKPSASSSAPASTATQIVKVSNSQDNLIFTPDDIKADVGSFVEFQFYPSNHSVAESSFDSPCEPLTGSQTIFSGFQPVSKGTTDVSFLILNQQSLPQPSVF